MRPPVVGRAVPPLRPRRLQDVLAEERQPDQQDLGQLDAGRDGGEQHHRHGEGGDGRHLVDVPCAAVRGEVRVGGVVHVGWGWELDRARRCVGWELGPARRCVS